MEHAAIPRIFWLRVILAAGLIAGFLLSPKLWLSSRAYPQAPVFAWMWPISPPFDYAVFTVMLGLMLATIGASRRRWPIIAFLVVSGGYALFDQSRWQPWFYQYWFMLLAIGWSRLAPCRVIVASIYFWSGVSKANPAFVHEAFPLLFPVMAKLGYVAPAIEAAIGVGLLTRFRRFAVGAAILMHAAVLVAIGPAGRNWDAVVWPWNVAMACLVVLLFWGEPEGLTAPWLSRLGNGGRGWFYRLIVVLFAIMPTLGLFGFWDNYLSFALYSGNANSATIYMSDAVADSLPDSIQEQITVNDSGVDELDLFDWSFAELHVPPYGEVRVFRSIGRQVCAAAGSPRDMVLMIRPKWTFFGQRRLIQVGC